MRRLVIWASVVALGASSASCGSSREGSNSADGVLSAASMVGPSMLEARRGGGGTTSGGGTISAPVMVNDVGTSGTSLGDKVTFNVSTGATAYPWVTVTCSQNGTQVYRQSNGIFPTSLNQIFTLGPTPNWQSGGADCTATLENWDGYAKKGSITALASVSFQALG